MHIAGYYVETCTLYNVDSQVCLRAKWYSWMVKRLYAKGPLYFCTSLCNVTLLRSVVLCLSSVCLPRPKVILCGTALENPRTVCPLLLPPPPHTPPSMFDMIASSAEVGVVASRSPLQTRQSLHIIIMINQCMYVSVYLSRCLSICALSCLHINVGNCVLQ